MLILVYGMCHMLMDSCGNIRGILCNRRRNMGCLYDFLNDTFHSRRRVFLNLIRRTIHFVYIPIVKCGTITQ